MGHFIIAIGKYSAYCGPMKFRGLLLGSFTFLLTAACSTIDSAKVPTPVQQAVPAAASAPSTYSSLPFQLLSSPDPHSAASAQKTGTKARSFGSLLKDDARHFVHAPFTWNRSQWAKAGAATALVGGVILLDDRGREEIARNSNSSTQEIAKAVEPFGAEYSWGVLGGFYLAGRYGHNEKSRSVARDGLASSLIAAGVITPILKVAVGRSRPSQTEGTFTTGEGGMSFPSGHTTQAFAVASVIASHYDSRLVKVAAYGLATAVGWSRMENNAHYASDVVAGALIGTLVGRTVVRLHSEHRVNFEAAPSLDPAQPGVALSMRTSSGEILRLFRRR